ncbi:unnamed protein product [Allacma fusca]|uniref:Gustatory receptor n=1 Tax=Allacma fusca TaxID=39272 RepID=A0A8J2PQB2_9HEXA|nr:unnamed protein product [Allacma fusca]
MILETTVLLVSGRFFRCKFMKGWAGLNEVYHGLCDAAADLQRIRVGSYIAVVIVALEHILVFIFSFLEANSCSVAKCRGYLLIIVESLRINLTWLIPTSLSLMFFFICLLIRSHFVTISEMLACILKKPNPKLHTKIDMVRILHEQLCETVSDFESYFGVQLLITLCTSCFMITVGAYSYIVQGEGISTAVYENAGWASKGQMYGAILMIIAIVTGGEMVTKAAVSSAPVLNSLSLSTLDDKSQIQVTAFLQKISAFPTKIRALRITTVSTTFLASASKNIITYLLVLMQFKLSLENSKKDNLNLTSFGGNNTCDDGRVPSS